MISLNLRNENEMKQKYMYFHTGIHALINKKWMAVLTFHYSCSPYGFLRNEERKHMVLYGTWNLYQEHWSLKCLLKIMPKKQIHIKQWNTHKFLFILSIHPWRLNFTTLPDFNGIWLYPLLCLNWHKKEPLT